MPNQPSDEAKVPVRRSPQRPSPVVLRADHDDSDRAKVTRNWNYNVDIKPHWIITALGGFVVTLHQVGII